MGFGNLTHSSQFEGLCSDVVRYRWGSGIKKVRFSLGFRYKSNQNSGRVGVRVSQSRVFPHCLGFRVFGYPTTSIVGSNPKILNFELPELGKTKPNLTLSSKPELWSWTHTNPESLNPNTFFPASSDRNYWGKNKIYHVFAEMLPSDFKLKNTSSFQVIYLIH